MAEKNDYQEIFGKWLDKVNHEGTKYMALKISEEGPTLQSGAYSSEISALIVLLWNSEKTIVKTVWSNGEYAGAYQRMRLLMKNRAKIILVSEPTGFVPFGFANETPQNLRLAVFYKTDLFSGIITADSGPKSVVGIEYLTVEKDFLYDLFLTYASSQLPRESNEEVTEDVGESGDTSIS